MEISKKKILGLTGLLAVFVFLLLNLNSKSISYSYKSPIWSDAAGYYSFLPNTFIYHWEVTEEVKELSEKTGNGYKIEDDKIRTKYSIGTSYLQSPFFLIAHGMAGWLDYKTDGYSDPYQCGVLYAGLFYPLIGLFFLYRFLILKFNKLSVVVTIITLLVTTNLYYYGMKATGMSHIYSFALYSVLLWLTTKLTSLKFKYFGWFIILSSLVILVRPTALIFVLFLAWYTKGFMKTLLSLISVNKLKSTLCVFLAILLWLPQLVYWKYLSGGLIHYSYTNEGFGIPQLIKFLFSPNNGLFVFAPALILAIIGAIYCYKKRIINDLKILVLFAAAIVLFSSWSTWHFGCSYGSRSLVEFYVPLSILVAHFIQPTISSKITSLKYVVGIIVGIFAYINLTIIYKYDHCYYGQGDWDWNEYYYMIF